MNFQHEHQEQKKEEQYIDEILVDLEKHLSNFKLTIEKKYRVIEQYVKLLKLTKTEYQKVHTENKNLKEKIVNLEKNNKQEIEVRPAAGKYYKKGDILSRKARHLSLNLRTYKNKSLKTKLWLLKK